MSNDNFKSPKEFAEYLFSGGKVKNSDWDTYVYIYFDHVLNSFINHKGEDVSEPWIRDEYKYFSPYVEPKKKREITLYRHTKETASYIFQTAWTSKESLNEWSGKLLHTETKTIEVDE